MVEQLGSLAWLAGRLSNRSPLFNSLDECSRGSAQCVQVLFDLVSGGAQLLTGLELLVADVACQPAPVQRDLASSR